MALPLETKIMNEIGLGNHYNWYNGSGSCRYIRERAAKKLENVIDNRVRNDEEIIKPIPKLMALGIRISKKEEGDYRLTDTYIALSYIIAHHIQMYNIPGDLLIEQTNKLANSLANRYLEEG